MIRTYKQKRLINREWFEDFSKKIGKNIYIYHNSKYAKWSELGHLFHQVNDSDNIYIVINQLRPSYRFGTRHISDLMGISPHNDPQIHYSDEFIMNDIDYEVFCSLTSHIENKFVWLYKKDNVFVFNVTNGPLQLLPGRFSGALHHDFKVLQFLPHLF